MQYSALVFLLHEMWIYYSMSLSLKEHPRALTRFNRCAQLLFFLTDWLAFVFLEHLSTESLMGWVFLQRWQ